jgi:uncharacterized protein YdaU (DUF1376 family)
MPLYIDQFWSSPSVARMTPAGKMGYFALLCAQWQSEDCSLSGDPHELAIASRLSDEEWEKSAAAILRKFHSIEGGRLRNPACHAKWEEAKKVYDARRDGGAKRKKTLDTNEGDHDLTINSPQGEHEVTPTLPLDDPTTFTETETETETETGTVKSKNTSSATGVASPRGNSGPDPVEAIYQAYPRKVGKQAALKAIDKAVEQVAKANGWPIRDAQEFLFERTQAYARSPAGNDGEYTPHPATWFNRGSYDDDPAEWRRNGDMGRSGVTEEEMSTFLDSIEASDR